MDGIRDATRGEECLNHRPEQRTVACDRGVDAVAAAREQDGAAVAADVARHDDVIAGPRERTARLDARQEFADARRRDEEAVHLAVAGDLRIARDDGDAGRFRCFCHRGGDGIEVVQGEALLDLEGAGEIARPRAHAGEVVDRAADGELADVASGELPRRDDEAVRRHGDACAVE